MVKNLPTNTEDVVSVLVQEDPLSEKEMATHSSILAYEISRAEEPAWLATVSGAAKELDMI